MKTVGDIASRVAGARVIGDRHAIITDIERDSRNVRFGTLFVCIPGAHVDGHDFIAQAAKSGATAILTTRDPEKGEVDLPEGMAAIVVPDLHPALEAIVPFYYSYPARDMRIIGITGTNGKTTTSYLLRAILRSAGFRVGLIGTIQIMIEEEIFPVHNTTPDVADLQKILDLMREKNMDYVIMEVSSHALDQNRVAGIEFDTAIFTNLTQDHLDYHKTIENYRLAKSKLFDLVSRKGVKIEKNAIINIDDPSGEFMLEHANCQKFTYSIEHESDFVASEINVTSIGSRFRFTSKHLDLELNLKITGIFNIYNAMAAASAALAEHIDPWIVKKSLEKFTSVPGRFERVDVGQDFSVIVDYAHTPDGVANVLRTARQIARKRILTVFGCGGDRDRTKRPIMGRLAAELSDVVIVTSDNPRSEDPQKILDEVEAGVLEKIENKTHECIISRREAIFHAINIAEEDDIVVILGKGHETYQILNDRTIHFDDRETAREAIICLASRGFSEIVTDSRKIESDCLFVALKGDKFNGEDFARDAIEKGAAGVIVSETCPAEKIPSQGKIFKVPNTLEAYQWLARFHRERFDIPVIAITGSNGKTTTKDLTAAVISSLGKIQKTAENFNNEIGLPLTLFGINENHAAAVVEMGMRGLGQIATLASIAEPTIGVVTNVGETHIELLGSIDNIARAKSELVQAIPPGGTVILNADDHRVAAMRGLARPKVRILTFGINKKADIQGSNVLIQNHRTTFEVESGNFSREFSIPMVGIHNVYDALAAIAVGFALNISAERIAEGLQNLSPTKMRLEIIERHGFRIINDTYNASPLSMRAAIETTAEISRSRKVAVLGDMLELGKIAPNAHRQIGECLGANDFEIVITCGELADYIAEGARGAGVPFVATTKSHEEALEILKSVLDVGDTILVKGSRGMRMERIVARL